MLTTQSLASDRSRRFHRFGLLQALVLAASVAGSLSAWPVRAQQESLQRRMTPPPLFSFPASGATAPAADINRDVRPALEAANLWLGLTDINRGKQSWEQAAPVFQRAISAADWAQSLQAARLPLGKVKSRKTKGAVFTRTIRGQPEGEYVVIQYDTAFEKKADAQEIVTMVFGIDSRWRVAGYLVR